MNDILTALREAWVQSEKQNSEYIHLDKEHYKQATLEIQKLIDTPNISVTITFTNNIKILRKYNDKMIIVTGNEEKPMRIRKR